jgi:hypothetical protein
MIPAKRKRTKRRRSQSYLSMRREALHEVDGDDEAQ